MIDNKERIKKLLKFGEDTYYYAQIIKRRKDNPTLSKSEVKISSVFLTSPKKLDEYWDFLTERANLENARIYISLTPRSLRKYTSLCLMEFSKRVLNNSYEKAWRVTDSVALSKNTIQTRGIIEGGGRWIVDIDSTYTEYKNAVLNFLWLEKGVRIEELLETPNGFHLVVRPFNYMGLLKDFRDTKDRDDYTFQKNNETYKFTLRREGNTILYAP